MRSVADTITVVEIDGLPYIAYDWLERRIYRDQVRAKRWRQEARRMENRTDRIGIALRSAYLHHARQSDIRVERWRQNLAVTRCAIETSQSNTRINFGTLIKERREAAGIKVRDLASRAGVDRKTINNIENASFPPSYKTLDKIISVPELRLSWNDVDPILLDENPADGRKHRYRKNPAKKRPPKGIVPAECRPKKRI